MRLQKLVAAIAMAGTLGAGYASALGLGEVRLNSALNQPLDAEIELLQVRELTRNEILSNLASRADFERAGIERPFSLTILQFKTIIRSDGTGYIHLTSNQLVREPFLNFLLEVHWPSGRLLREYTLLLDPPTFSDQPSNPVRPASTQNNSDAASQPFQQHTNPFDHQVAPANTQKSWQTAIPAPEFSQSQQPVQRVKTVSKPAPSAPSSVSYQVKPDESLWGIARTIRPASNLSIQQTMLAIQKRNPEAFMGGNINRLKKGQVLRVPTREDIASVSFQDAVSEVARQNREWQARREQLDATRRTSVEPAVDKVREEGKLSIVGTGQTSGSGRDLGGGTAEPGDTNLQSELMVSQEKLDLITRENVELKSRLKDLDDQISTLKRLIELKDDQMAALQQQDIQVPPEPASTPAPVAEPKPAAAQPGFMDFLFSNPLYLALAGLIPLGLVGALLVYRRRKEEGEEDIELDDDLIVPAALAEADEVVIDEELELDEEMLELDEEDLVEEFHTEEETTQQTEDAISEADIYIAYGRFPQAEELLNKAIASEPERADLRLKLLEVHAENNDLDKFRQALTGVESLGDRNAIRQADAFKARFPANAFAGQNAGSEGDDDLEEFDLEGALSEEGADKKDDFDSIDYDLDDLDHLDGLNQQSSAAETRSDEDDLSFDLDDLDLSLDKEPEQSEQTSAGSEDELPDLDLDFDDLDISLEDDKEEGKEPSADKELSFETDESVTENSAKEESTESEGLSFDDGLPDLESALEEDDFDFLSDDDETATKLDLARAYIDMGDREGAQDILQEVIESGSDEQREEAQSLLEQASS